MESVVLDSSAIIAFHNPHDAHHQSILEALSRSRARFLISTVTVTETLIAAQRISTAVADQMLADLEACFGPFINVDTKVALLAARIRAKTSIAIPDALISASATTIGAGLWTFDAGLAKAHKGSILLS